MKHSVQCDFAATSFNSASSSPASYPTAGGINQSTPASYQDEQGISREDSVVMRDVEASPSLCIVDLELLHNYSTSTCFTVSYEPVLRTLWRINVPQLAFSHDYVMRSILAVSGLHLAYYNPERKDFYISQAMIHHQIGLRTASAHILTMSKDNYSALYIFSALTCIFALASPRRAEDFLLFADNGTPEWLLLLRGTKAIFEVATTELETGILAALFRAGERRVTLQKSNTTEGEHLAELRHFIATTVTDPHASQVYATNIDILDKSYKIVYVNSPCTAEIADVFNWPYRVTEDYLILLRQRTQEALSIFAYFCVLLKALDSYWWMNGWSQHLINKLYGLLDEEHRLWIRWPIEEIGVVLNHSTACQF